MSQLDSDSNEVKDITAHLQYWQQGDCTKDLSYFVHMANSQLALTEESGLLTPGDDLVITDIKGFVLLTQTCDIVRHPLQRPYLQVSPLIEVSVEKLIEIKKGIRPQYLYIPTIAKENLVGDLDRVLTIEKSILVDMQRIAGCLNDRERIQLGQCLARKFKRFAFPDEFTKLFNKLQQRIKSKHNKQSEEALALQSLDEIRVYAENEWDEEHVSLTLYFIVNEKYSIDENLGGKSWIDWSESWLELIEAHPRYDIQPMVVHLEDITAKDYVLSVPLELDYLSQSI